MSLSPPHPLKKFLYLCHSLHSCEKTYKCPFNYDKLEDFTWYFLFAKAISSNDRCLNLFTRLNILYCSFKFNYFFITHYRSSVKKTSLLTIFILRSKTKKMVTLRVEHNVKVIGDKSLQGLQSCCKNTNDTKLRRIH